MGVKCVCVECIGAYGCMGVWGVGVREWVAKYVNWASVMYSDLL